jgi:antitoxin FitA
MASITVRNLDDGVKKRLRKQAAENGRSLEAEVRDILNRTTATQKLVQLKTGLDLFRPLLDVAAKHGGFELELPPRTPIRELPFHEEVALFRPDETKKRKSRR